MNTSTPDGGVQKTAQARKRALTVNKACIPCRARKVKCDAAIVGLPCSSCRSRQCVEDCTPLVRKGRTRKEPHRSSVPGQTLGTPATSERKRSEAHSRPDSTSDSRENQSQNQNEQDLLYLHILNDAGEETPGSIHTTSTVPDRQRLDDGPTLRSSSSAKLSHLDEIDRQYLTKKGVFDLPPENHLDALVKIYFDRIHLLIPVIDRVDFIRHYQSGDCSLLLLRVILTTAFLHAPADVLSACGFASRSDAVYSSFCKTRLLYDFGAEDDPLLLLQASIILCMVILDHPTHWDFGYWFHNAVNLATKLNLRDSVSKETKPRQVLKLYRRIWWALYCLDVFHVFINTKRSRLLGNGPDVKPLTAEDWEDEHVIEGSSDLFSPVTHQQKALYTELCEMRRICGECLSTVKSQLHQDPRQIMRSLDTWRQSLASRIDGNVETNSRYLSMQAMSYRFECILVRRIRRSLQPSGPTDWRDWTKQRYRSVILELDTIAMRVLASGTLEQFPMPLITTITALLALHIESALDPNETDLIRSMSRISISQTMLVLNQGRDIPVLKRALPIFEDILTKKGLYLVPSSSLSQSNLPVQLPSQGNNTTDAYASPHSPVNGVEPQVEQWKHNPPLDINFLGFDFLDDWQQIGQLDSF